MLNIRKFAAIDIGSNAVRLLIANIIEEDGKKVRFKKSSLVRVPVRLGVDAFVHQKISEENKSLIIKAFRKRKNQGGGSRRGRE